VIGAALLLLQAIPAPPAPPPPPPAPAQKPVEWVCSLEAPDGRRFTVKGTYAGVEPKVPTYDHSLETEVTIAEGSGILKPGRYPAGMTWRDRKYYRFVIRGEKDLHVSFDYYEAMKKGVMSVMRAWNANPPRFEPVGIGYCDAAAKRPATRNEK
jgi:hypothetical protein